MKNLLIFVTLILSFNLFSFENIYVSPNLERNVSHFISNEVVIAINHSVEELNSMRDNQKSLEKIFVNETELANFKNLINNQKTLPKILMKDGIYSIEAEGSKVTFSIQDLLQKQLRINQQLIHYKNHKDLESILKKVTTTQYIFSKIIDSAYALELSATDANRLVIASVIALNNNLENAGMVCMITCDTVKINFKAIAVKIAVYKQQCEQAIAEQNSSVAQANQQEKSSLVKLLGYKGFEQSEDVNDLMSKINESAKLKTKDMGAIINKKLNSDLADTTCEKQVEPYMKSGLARISNYAQMDSESVDTVAIPKFCSNIGALKQCLVELYANNTRVTQTLKAKYINVEYTEYSNLGALGPGKSK